MWYTKLWPEAERCSRQNNAPAADEAGEDNVKAYFDHLFTGGQEAFFRKASDALEKEEKLFVVTANPETFMIGRDNPEFDALLKKEHTVIVPDGIGVVKAAGMLDIPLDGRITGVDFVTALFRMADEKKKKVYLYGAKPEVLDALVERLKREYPGIVLAGARDGYQNTDEEVFADMLETKPDIVLVALGIPRQELLIDRYYDQFGKGIFVGVGGSFDVLSGLKKRAPRFFVQCNLEWLYRIATEPKRLKRFYNGNIKFIFEIRREKKAAGKDR